MRILKISLRLFLSLVILLTAITVSIHPPSIKAATLTAHAGPDQTVSGPSPPEVLFDATQSVGSFSDEHSYKWFNQWGELRAEGPEPVFKVNFGYRNPKPGTTRTFTLQVTDSAGNTARDTVKVTLGDLENTQRDPRVGSWLRGIAYAYEATTTEEYHFNLVTVGHLIDKDRWYVGNRHSTVEIGQVTCVEGRHWNADGLADGCTGPGKPKWAMELKPIYDASRTVRNWEVWYRTDLIATIRLADDVEYHFQGDSEIDQRIQKE
jgi:hypothetical protein